jgi:ribulose 1,5-bisphosphate carboxylase large subunit-like protein
MPDVFFDKFLSQCGVDIMYPGGFVALPGNKRHYNATEDITLLAESINRYTSHVHRSHFIPTISGGVSTGLLHLYYELYGPKVSLFLGGAVATNKNGMEAGAALCIKVLDHAIACRRKLAKSSRSLIVRKDKLGDKSLKDLPLLEASTVKQIKDETDSEYIIPQEFLAANKLTHFTQANWNYWTSDDFDFT